MKKMTLQPTVLLLAILSLKAIHTHAQPVNDVKVVGAMKNVMWKGELFGTINLDTISNKQHLYGLGPVEYLTGEIMVMDGRAYKSIVGPDLKIKVEETYALKAPFFAYANIPKWNSHDLPDSIQTLEQLETYLDQPRPNGARPYLFRLSGMVEKAAIHVLNLTPGTTVSSPDDAHKETRTYHLANEQVEMIGFFSKEHKAIFTHHDTYLHLHLITADKKKMGHLEEAVFKPSTIKLYLPAD